MHQHVGEWVLFFQIIAKKCVCLGSRFAKKSMISSYIV